MKFKNLLKLLKLNIVGAAMQKNTGLPEIMKQELAEGLFCGKYSRRYRFALIKKMTSDEVLVMQPYIDITQKIFDIEEVVASVSFKESEELVSLEKKKFLSIVQASSADGKNVQVMNKLDKVSVNISFTERESDHTASTLGQCPPTLPKKEKTNYKKIASSLKEVIFGQDEIIDDVIKKVMRKDFSLSCDKTKPVSMFWPGPTGVGKTELGLQLAKFLNYGTTRIDMSEYMKEHEVSKLTGAPPGYTGYGDPSALEECNGKKCVIIFDEIEKAHPKIHNIFLQILDYGVLTDGKGKQIDLTQCIIIMTSNVGASEMNRPKIGIADESFESKRSTIMKEMSNVFPPEFINRLSSIQIFNSLTQEIVDKLISNKMNKITKAVKEKYHVSFEVTEPLKTALTAAAYNPLMGARPMERSFEEFVLEPLSEFILTEDETPALLTIDLDDQNKSKIRTNHK